MRLLNRFWPKSLYSQILMAAAIALLIAQIINAAFLLNGLRDRGVNEAGNILINSAAIRLQGGGFEPQERAETREERRAQRRAERRERREERRNLNGQGIRNLDYVQSNDPLILNGFSQDDQLSERASAVLSLQAIVRKGPIAQIPDQLKGRMFNRQIQRYMRTPNARLPDKAMIISFQSDGQYIYAARPIRPVSDRAVWTLIIQTLLLYAILLSVLAIIARRISRPLDRLKDAMAHFGPNNLGHAIEANGPHDVRALIDNYNDMRRRISALLSEKDVMLGAIGHDLKTPLASLRVRVESIDDEDERLKMISSIDDMNVMLGDILMLARLGKSNEALQKTNIDALIETVMDDFPEQSDAINFDITVPITASVKPALLRRALRNIISNALRYGRNADIGTRIDGDHYNIIISDNGPGIDPQNIETVFEPFERLERSRNKMSGGSGLGLTIARAIVKAHGGEIILQNQNDSGLKVIITLPL